MFDVDGIWQLYYVSTDTISIYPVVGAGAAMVAHGLRKHTSDLDLWMGDVTFYKYKEITKRLVKTPTGDMSILNPDTTLYPMKFGEYDFMMIYREDPMLKEAPMMMAVMTHDALYKQKERLFHSVGRSYAKKIKDMVDMKLLSSVIANQ